jgi:hypothetical protein
MFRGAKPKPSEIIAGLIIQHAEDIEEAYGIYLDESVAELVTQALNMIFESMVYQTKLIRENEERYS